MNKINPANYITDNDPVDEAVLDASGWYETEYIELKEAERDQMPWMLAQGWQRCSWGDYEDDDGKVYLLGRRTLRPEYALNELIKSFTNAYNEGREVNDQRYDDIIALYAVMLDKTENEIIASERTDVNFNNLLTPLINAITTDRNNYEDDVGDIFDDWGESREDEINTQFDNLLETRRYELIQRGMYNTTVWDTISAGVERERAKALTDLADQIAERQIGVKDKIYAVKAELQGKVIAAWDRLYTQLQARDTERSTLRNNVLNALLNFMERRTDGYPDLGAIAKIASDMGAGTLSGYVPS